jgi:putative transposase
MVRRCDRVDDSAMTIISKRARGHASLRRGRHSEAGRIYLVTFITRNRECTFANWEVAAAVARASLNPVIWRASRLLCWVLMPDHWHGLIELGELDALSNLVNRLKGSTARIVNAIHGRPGHLWAKGFHDHALRADEELLPTARYIISNPVRAGLVQRVGMYPFWDSVWLDWIRASTIQNPPCISAPPTNRP